VTARFATQAVPRMATDIPAVLKTQDSIETRFNGMNSSQLHNRPDAERFRLEGKTRGCSGIADSIGTEAATVRAPMRRRNLRFCIRQAPPTWS